MEQLNTQPENATDSERNIKWQKITEISQNHHFLGSLSWGFLFLEVSQKRFSSALLSETDRKTKDCSDFYQSSLFIF